MIRVKKIERFLAYLIKHIKDIPPDNIGYLQNVFSKHLLKSIILIQKRFSNISRNIYIEKYIYTHQTNEISLAQYRNSKIFNIYLIYLQIFSVYI